MLLRLLFLITVTGIAANAADIRIAVSDLIADDISETVQMLAEASSVEITVISIGSLPAMDALRLDEISLAVVATPEGNELLDDTLKVFPFAYSTAVVAVSAANPVNEVSFYEDAIVKDQRGRDRDIVNRAVLLHATCSGGKRS